MAIQSPYEQITRELMGGLHGQPPLSSINGMTNQPTALMQPTAAANFGVGQGGLTNSFAAQPASAMGSIAAPAIASQPTNDHGGGGHRGGHSQNNHRGERLGLMGTLGAIFKGVVSPITNMLSSPEAFLTGVLIIGGCILLEAVTLGAATPFLIGAGVVLGGKQIYDGSQEYSEAETAEEQAKAIEHMAAGGTAIVAAGYAANVRHGGKGVASGAKNLLKTAKEIPGAAVESTKILTSRQALDNATVIYENAGNLSAVSRGLKPKGAKTKGSTAKLGRAPAPKKGGTPKPPKKSYIERKETKLADAKAAVDKADSKLTDLEWYARDAYMKKSKKYADGKLKKEPDVPKCVEKNPELSYEHSLKQQKYEDGIAFMKQYQALDPNVNFNGSFVNALGISSEFTA